jgi:capsular exopolysaccharide synthesis family protein
MDPQKTSATAPPDAKLHFLDYWRIIRIRKTVILAVFLLVVVTTVVVTLILPRAYCGTARIKVSKDRPDISPLFESQSDVSYDPYFIQTEFEVIKSQVVLDKVIENLNLNAEWGKRFGSGESLKTSETRTLLEHFLDLRPARNTSIIEICFYSEDPDEAARVANEIATVYQDYRLEQRNGQTLQGIKALQQEYDLRMEKIRQEQTNVDNLRIALGINEEEAAGDAPSPVIEQVTLQRLEGERIEASVSFAKEQEQLENLKAKSPEELKNALPTVVTDHQLDDLLTELSQAQTALAGLRKDYGPENPEVIKTSAIVDNLTGQVDARIDGTLVGLQSRVDADKAALDKLTESVESARTTDVEKVAKSRPYYDAKQKLQELEAFAKALNIKIASTTVELELPKTTMVEITDRADPTTLKPVKPNRPLNIALGIIFGLIVGVGLAFFIEYLDTSVKTIDDVERALQAPVLGVIPQNVGRLIDEGAESPHAEAYRVLRTNLLFSRKDEKLNTIAIVSAGAGEGKSTTIFNLATVFAQNGQRVVVVDSDLRRPSLHKFLRVSNSIGLTNYLLKQNTLEEVIQTTNVPTLDFMASGKLPSSSMGILSSAAMKGLISELKQRYDFVFFDSPPIMGVSDASILASEVDMTLQVIQYRRYPQPMNIRAKQLIEKVGGNLMGIVLNNINMSQDESYYYYSGYYHEYYSKHDEEDADDDASGAKARLDIKQKY